MVNVEDFLKYHQINYTLHEHPAVFTCEEAERCCGNIPGMACKNLFLRDKSGKRYFLLSLPAKKRTDLKKFAKLVGANKISFGSAETLYEKLGLTPGAVSLFGILNDQEKQVELYIDQELYDAEIVGFHPNRNTATLELSHEMLEKFLASIDHKAHIISL